MEPFDWIVLVCPVMAATMILGATVVVLRLESFDLALYGHALCSPVEGPGCTWRPTSNVRNEAQLPKSYLQSPVEWHMVVSLNRGPQYIP